MNVASAEALNQTSLDEILIRWKLAELYMSALQLDDNFPPGHALRLLIRRDVARLLQEVRRLRPDLA
jgi:hypothetical protein